MKKYLFGTLLLIGIANYNTSFAQSSLGQAGENPTSKWTETEIQNDIVISFSKINIEGVMYLAIQLENPTNQVQEIVWSLLKGKDILIDNVENSIEASSKIEIFDATQLIPFEENNSYADYSIQLNLH